MGKRMEDIAKNQLDEIRKISEAKNPAEGAMIFSKALEQIHVAQKQMSGAIIGGKIITETDIYKSHLPIFTRICEQTQLSGYIKVIQILASSMSNAGIPTQTDLTLQGTVVGLAKGIDQELNNKIVAALFWPNDETMRILKGLADYDVVSNQTNVNLDPIAKKKIALDLYKDAFELYLKILKDIYFKLTNEDAEKAGNQKLYDFYNLNYPVLMISVNNVLRNDGGHLNYDEREKYSAEQLLSESNNLIIALFTAMIAFSNVNVGFFETILKSYNIVTD